MDNVPNADDQKDKFKNFKVEGLTLVTLNSRLEKLEHPASYKFANILTPPKEKMTNVDL